MAKELPFFKFEPAQWENGSIQICAFEVQGVFISVCSMYWQRLGDLPYKLAVQKICKGNATALDSLIGEDVIKLIDGHLCIDFLNEQLSEFKNISQTNSDNARSGWENRRKNATASQPHNDPNAIREEKKRKEEKKEEKIIGAVSTATPEQRASEFMTKVSAHIPEYEKKMLREFYDYWTEMNEGGRKMRFEMQKVFDISRRLKTWETNETKKQYGSGKGINAKQQHTASLIAGIAERRGLDTNGFKTN